MYLTVCFLHDQCHDSSVGEWMYLTVRPLGDPGHDSSVGEWMYLTVCPPGGPAGVFQKIFLGWLHSGLESAWHKMAQSPFNGTTRHVHIEEDSHCPTMGWQRPNKERLLACCNLCSALHRATRFSSAVTAWISVHGIVSSTNVLV